MFCLLLGVVPPRAVEGDILFQDNLELVFPCVWLSLFSFAAVMHLLSGRKEHYMNTRATKSIFNFSPHSGTDVL
jgi:hypothetical protein